MGFLAPAVPAITGAAATVGGALTTAAPYLLAAGTLYSMQQNIAIGNQQAAYSQVQAKMAQDAYALRKQARKKEMAQAIGQQRALYSVSGVDIFEGTPVDVFADTASNFGYEQFSDAYDTAGRIYGYEESGRQAKKEGYNRAFGNLLDYGLSYARRG